MSNMKREKREMERQNKEMEEKMKRRENTEVRKPDDARPMKRLGEEIESVTVRIFN